MTASPGGFLAVSGLLIAACLAPLAAANSQGCLTVDGRQRTYEFHVPASYKTDLPIPLVLVLHGRLGDGRGTVALTHFDRVSDAHGFLAVSPTACTAAGQTDQAQPTPTNKVSTR